MFANALQVKFDYTYLSLHCSPVYLFLLPTLKYKMYAHYFLRLLMESLGPLMRPSTQI